MRWIPLSVVLTSMTFFSVNCSPKEPNELDKLGTVRVTIKDRPFELWIADSDEESERGLMFVTSEEMAPLADGTGRGMIFVFDHEKWNSFWMKNTIIPLDIAYIDSSGTVVTTYTMAPLDERHGQYAPQSAYRYVIELSGDMFSEIGLVAGDHVEIPQSLLKQTP